MTTATDQTAPEAESLTSAELDAVRRYAAIIEGIPDCFDCGDGIGAIPDCFTREDTLGMIRSYFGMLGTWREAIETLRDDLLPLRKDGVRDLSTAGHRYVGAELVSWHRAREGWRVGTIEYLLGKDKYDCPFDTATLVDGYRYDDGTFWVNATR